MMVRLSADDSSLIEALESFGLSVRSTERSKAVLSALKKRVGASRGAVYFRDPRGQSLEPLVVLGSKRLGLPLAVERIAVPASGVGPAAALVDAEVGVGRSRRGGPGGMAVYVTKADSCVALVRLEGGRPELVNETSRRALRALASLLLVVYGQRSEVALQAAESTELEVSRSVRHEAANYLDVCQTCLREIWVAVRGSELESAVEQASESLLRVRNLLDRLRAQRLDPGDEVQSVPLRHLWEQATERLGEAMSAQRVVARYVGADIEINVRTVWFVNALLNLLTNSVDAFREQAKHRRERWIELSVGDPGRRAQDVSLVYRDNAGGINPATLKGPPESAGQPVQQLIFEPGVTSKKGGTGFGLFLVRSILDAHGGSIDLLDYRGGVTFAISLPARASRVG